MSEPETSEYEDYIAVEAVEREEADVPVVADTAALDEPRKSRWPLWIALGLLLGFGLSFAASWLTRPAPFDAGPMTTELRELRAEVTALRDRPEPEAATVDLAPLSRRIAALEDREPVDLSDIEARLLELESREPAPVDEALVARLEALRDDGFTAAPPPDLSTLTSRLDALEAQPLPDSDITVTLEPLERRLSALEAREVAPAQPAEPAPILSDLPRFPAAALREAAEARRGGLLSRHIRVRSEDDPLSLIEGVEADLAAGRAAAALAKFDRLPEPMRNLARGWRADMQTALEAQR